MWKELAFEDCLQKVKTPPKLPKKDYLSKGKFPVIAQEAELINGYCDDVSMVFYAKEPLVIFGDHTQVLKYINFDFVMGADGGKILQPISDIDAKFFFYYLSVKMPKSIGYARHYRLLKELIFHIPSLSEQQRIVAKLDSTFTEIDTAIIAIEGIVKENNTLLNSLVKNLVTSETTNSNLSKIKNLISEIITGPFGSTLHKSDYCSEGVAVINPQNINDGNITPSKDKFITIEKASTLKKYIVKKGDILVARRGEMGRCALVRELKFPMLCGTGCMILRANADVEEEFLVEIISSAYVRNVLTSNAVGATMLNLNQKILLDIVVSVRSKDQQLESIQKIKKYRNAIERYSYLSIKKKENFLQLKSAILAQELLSDVI